MLSMKTLRVAIVTMGSALLLGPGLAMAQADTMNLNGTGDAAHTPLVYAQETLPQAGVMGRRAVALKSGTNMDIAVKPRRAIDAANQEIYVRIDLSGAQFSAAPTLVSGAATGDLASLTGTLSSGGVDSAFAVVRIGANVGATDLLGVRIAGSGSGADLNVTTDTGNVTATITAYTDPDDALDQEGTRSTFAGTGTIIRLVSGLSVAIKAAPKPVASVDTGFVRFTGPADSNGTARLGWLGVQENIMPGADAAPVRNADDGVQIERGDILAVVDPSADPIVSTGMVSFNVMGNLDIGAFNIKAETFADGMPETPANATGTCDGGAADTVDRGDLVGADNMPLIGEEGELPSGVEAAGTGPRAPDVYLLCLNVDVTGVASNMMAIPEGDYSATAYIDGDGSPATPEQMVGEGMLASIDRDGASVEIPYLTTSEKHNQRLIIVNRGTRPAAITNIDFTTEDGTEVELMDTVQAAMDAGLLVVPAQSSWVARMDRTISITGDSRRVAASVAFAATGGHLSVATTQINVSDGSTDTVVYDVMD